MEKSSSKKEDEDFETKIQKIIDTFTKAEKMGKENSKKYKDWIKDISNPNFKLISNLLNYFLDDLTSTNMRENIFKIMRKLYQLNKEVVGPQINSNKDFAKSIVVHINTGDKSKISDNCFYLLTKLFNHKAFKSEIDEPFILALFEGLSIVREEDINIKEPIILNNEHDDMKKIRILKCLDDLMSSYKKSIFYESDLESFIDILLPKLQMTDNNELKKKLLECLDKVTKYNEYYGQMYKVDEITELMEDFESTEDQPDEIRNISRQIVINITDRQGKNKKNNEDENQDY